MAILETYLKEILGFIKVKNVEQLKQYLRVEPTSDLPQVFFDLRTELQQSYQDSNALHKKVDKLLPENYDATPEEGDVWGGFLNFIKEFLEYWRDAGFNDNLVQTHTQLSTLANACVTALSHATYGILVLPATMQICAVLANLTMIIDKRPDLKLQVRKVTSDDGGESRKSLVEGTAELIQRAFTICLTERSSNRSGIGKDGAPEGKKVGIYSFANLVLKLLFQCRKTRLANQLFTNISQHSPPLGLYSAKQRVTYLYFLGRYLFSNNHFYRAQHCLQSAYDQCHAQCLKQRRLILIYLVASNMIMGRFPSERLLARPEAQGLYERISPITKAIKKGDLLAFKNALGPTSGNEQWLFQKGLLLPFLYRCEVLVWRSLARRVFLLTYQFPSDPNSRKAPTLDLSDLTAAAQHCQKMLEGWQKPVDSMVQMQSGRTHPNSLFLKTPDLVSPRNGTKKLVAHEGTIFGNKMPQVLDVEAIVASLVQQGLLRGFISHNQGKFAILGAKQRGGPLNAGFPSVWEILKLRAEREGKDVDVPGWVQTERKGPMGQVINLSGARPVGAG